MIEWQEWLHEKIEEQQNEGSHFEPQPFTFHPSQLGYCKRQCLLSKLGIKKHSSDTLRIFEMGNIIHEYLQEHLKRNDEQNRFEVEKELTVQIPSTNNIKLTGHCDVFDNALNIVYDFKTRNGWYKFDPPNERHMIQLELYQYMLWRTMLHNDSSFSRDSNIYGQVVYVSKEDLEMRQVPESTVQSFNPQNDEESLAKNALEKANEIGSTLISENYPRSNSEIPFKKCGCWVCENEGEKQYEHLDEHNVQDYA